MALSLTALTLTLLSGAIAAHDSVEFMTSRRARLPASVVISPSTTTSFDSQGIALLGSVPLGDLGGATGSDCWGYTSGSGREYAIMGTRSSVVFIEITDPGKPVIVQNFAAVNSLWRDIKTYQTYAYWVSEGGDGVQIADMSQIDNGIVSYVGAAFDGGSDSTHNLAIDTDAGFLYRCGGGGFTTEGLRIFSLANPAAPSFVGSWSDRYVHDAQVVTYTSGPFANKQVAFCFSETESGGGTPGIDILDVTNKNNITKISDAFYGSAVFSHQGWLSPDRQTLYVNDELDETSFGTPTTTRVLNVSNLNNPQVVGTFTTGNSAIDHNLYTKGNLIFEANYRSGLRVFDATNPLSPVETAYFDTFPLDDAAEFNGIWNAYPYFDSGTVIGSDFERGLFIWRLGERELDIVVSNGPSELIDPNGEAFMASISAQAGASLDATSPRLHVDSGSGFVEIPLSDFGGGNYGGNFPSFDCADEVEWYLSARTTGGVTWTAPQGAPGYVYGGTAANTEMVLVEENMQSSPGWSTSAPGDDASTGIWERVTPLGTEAQPYEDHSDPGSQCFVTGQGSAFGSLGENDVDDGTTTLTTDDIDLSGGDAVISYWRWYSNATGSATPDDALVIDVSDDGGDNWVNVETIGPLGNETYGGWFQHSFQVSDLVTPTHEVRLRFMASDNGSSSIVEAGVDDFEVTRFDCGVCQTNLGFGGPGSAQLSICGQPLDSGNSATLTLENAAPSSLAVLFLGLSSNPTSFKGGQLVPVPVFRQVVMSTDINGEISFAVPGGSGPISVYAQYGIADASQPFGAALSNAVELVFGP